MNEIIGVDIMNPEINLNAALGAMRCRATPNYAIGQKDCSPNEPDGEAFLRRLNVNQFYVYFFLFNYE